jgi:cytochrome c553
MPSPAPHSQASVPPRSISRCRPAGCRCAPPPLQAPRSDTIKFSEEDIAKISAYVASLAPGPAIPSEEMVDPTKGDPAKGGELFRVNCAMCHNSSGAGGALTRGKYAPSLMDVAPKDIYMAMETGPQSMPVFNDTNLDSTAKRDIIAFLKSVEEGGNPGGLSLGRLGPVTEGMFAWIFGLGLLVGIAVWLGRRPHDTRHRRPHPPHIDRIDQPMNDQDITAAEGFGKDAVRLDEGHVVGQGGIPDRFENPGLPPHVPRGADLSEAAAKRAEKQVAGLFTLSILGTVLFVLAYFARRHPHHGLPAGHRRHEPAARPARGRHGPGPARDRAGRGALGQDPHARRGSRRDAPPHAQLGRRPGRGRAHHEGRG